MQMRVHQMGNEVFVELSGVGGRQDRVLLALSECQRGFADQAGVTTSIGEVTVRARANDMRIRLRSTASQGFDAKDVYRCLRRMLIEQPDTVCASAAGAGA